MVRAWSELQGADQGHHQQGVGGDNHDVWRWPRPRVLHHHARPWKNREQGWGGCGVARTPRGTRVKWGFVGFFVCLALIKLLGMPGMGIWGWALGIHPGIEGIIWGCSRTESGFRS